MSMGPATLPALGQTQATGIVGFAFQVISALGEWGVGASLVMEQVPAERRGF